MITVSNIKKTYGSGSGKVEALKGVSCTIEAGEKCVIIGSSGSGKSTLLNCIGGLETPDEGEILVDGTEITHLKKEDLLNLPRNFQTSSLSSSVSALLLPILYKSCSCPNSLGKTAPLFRRHHTPQTYGFFSLK